MIRVYTVLAGCFSPMLRQIPSPYMSIMPVGLCLCLNENQLSQNCFAPDSGLHICDFRSCLVKIGCQLRQEIHCQACIPLSTEGDYIPFFLVLQVRNDMTEMIFSQARPSSWDIRRISLGLQRSMSENQPVTWERKKLAFWRACFG